jgi:hypothetical protein
MEKWSCPICGNENSQNKICTQCRYDHSTDFEAFRSISPVGTEDAEVRVQLKMNHLWKKRKLQRRQKRNKRSKIPRRNRSQSIALK